MNRQTAKLKTFIESSNNRKLHIVKIIRVTAHTGHPWVHLEKYCRKYWRMNSGRLRGVDWIEIAAHFDPANQAATTNGDATTCE